MKKQILGYLRCLTITATSTMSNQTNPSRSSSPKVERGYKDRPSALPESGYPSPDVKPIASLPPISIVKQPAPSNATPMVFYPPSPNLDNSEDDLPAGLVHPDMPFNTVADVNAPRIPLSIQSIPSSPIQPSKASRSSTTASMSSEQTRDAVLEMMSMFTTSAPPRRRYGASQIAQWRAEEEYHKGKIQQELGGKEICLIRYEPRQGWLGFWNKENVLDIIDDLRELRSPKP